MKKFLHLFTSTKLIACAMFLLLFVGACKDDDEPMDLAPIASFQVEVAPDNFLSVTFTNFSQNATTYAWDFGDGNSSTDENPTHVYAAAGDYTVTLTASNDSGESNQKSESISLTDPNSALSLLAGTSSKTWYLQREGIALGVGPVANDNQYWSFGGVAPLGDRPCVLDDKYIFHQDGTFEFQSNGTIFIDSPGNGGWLGDGSVEACYDEAGNLTAASGEDLSAFGDGGDYTYEYNGTDNTLVINGLGAYIGLANKTATGDNFIPQARKEYTVFNFVEGDIADSLQIALVGDIAWNFYLVSYKNESDLPPIPASLPSSSFTFTKEDNTVTFINNSSNATSYNWDFGDGNMSSEESPIHTYAADGEYTVTLTAMDDQGNSVESSQSILITSAQFSAATLSNADGRVWKLAGDFSFYVGPAPNSGEWWPGVDQAGVDARPCQFNDEFIFFDSGTYEFNANGDMFAEDYMLGIGACIAEADVQAPYDALTSGTYSFEVTEAAGDAPAQIKVIGTGAFIGFAKAINGGELNGTVPPASEITYDVLEYAKTDDKEIITLVIDIAGDGTAWWTIIIESDL